MRLSEYDQMVRTGAEYTLVYTSDGIPLALTAEVITLCPLNAALHPGIISKVHTLNAASPDVSHDAIGALDVREANCEGPFF